MKHVFVDGKIPCEEFDKRLSPTFQRNTGNCRSILEVNIYEQDALPFPVAGTDDLSHGGLHILNKSTVAKTQAVKEPPLYNNRHYRIPLIFLLLLNKKFANYRSTLASPCLTYSQLIDTRHC